MATKKTTEEMLEIVRRKGKEHWDEINHYKKIAENKAKGNRYEQADVLPIRDKLAEYIEDQRKRKEPLTMAGLQMAAGLNRDTWARFIKGELDYKLYEYIDKHNLDPDLEDSIITDENGQQILLSRMSDILKSAKACVQEQLEKNCYTNKGNPAGSIFGLKAAFDWQDTPPDQRTTNNNTLVLNNIATLDEAKEAIRRLTE